jgi:hypothetical protein
MRFHQLFTPIFAAMCFVFYSPDVNAAYMVSPGIACQPRTNTSRTAYYYSGSILYNDSAGVIGTYCPVFKTVGTGYTSSSGVHVWDANNDTGSANYEVRCYLQDCDAEDEGCYQTTVSTPTNGSDRNYAISRVWGSNPSHYAVGYGVIFCWLPAKDDGYRSGIARYVPNY